MRGISSSAPHPSGVVAETEPTAAAAEVKQAALAAAPGHSEPLARLDRVAAAFARPPAESPPAALAYLSSALSEDFFRFLPPEERKGFVASVKDAVAGSWTKLRTFGRWLSGKSGGDFAPLALPPEEAKLDLKDLQALRSLIDGPIAEIARERAAHGGSVPTDLASLATFLKDASLRKALIERFEQSCSPQERPHAEENVRAALIVAATVVDQLGACFNVSVFDREALDKVLTADGRIDPTKLSKLSPPLRILLTDPALASRAIGAVRGGAVISAQVGTNTPAHILEGLRDYSAKLAGGSFLWVEEFVRTGKRPTLTRGEVRRRQEELDHAARGLDGFVAKNLDRMIAALPDDTLRSDVRAAFVPEEPQARMEALDRILARSDVQGIARYDIQRFRNAIAKADEIRHTDPEATLREAEKHLDEVDRFRNQSVRIRIHGRGTATEAGLEGATKKNKHLGEYAARLLTSTVSYDYANEASKTARQIITGVAALSMIGIPVQEHLGEGVMHTLLATAEDIAAEYGEIRSLTDQGVAIKEILRGARFVGLAATFAGATWAASQAHKALAAEKGALAGLALGLGSCALTTFTTVQSYLLFRRVGNTLAREGKLPVVDGVEIKKTLDDSLATALRDSPDMKPSTFRPLVHEAFEAAYRAQGGVPSGAQIVAQLRERGAPIPETAQNEFAAAHDRVLAAVPALQLREDLRAMLSAPARRAADIMFGETAPVPPEYIAALQSAFDEAEKKVQGLPNGRALVTALQTQGVKLFSAAALGAIRSAQDDAIAILGSGANVGSMLDGIANDLASHFKKALEQQGIVAKDPQGMVDRIKGRLARIDESKDLDPVRMAAIVRETMTEVLESASNGRPLSGELTKGLDEAEGLVRARAQEFTTQLETDLVPELKKLADRFGFAQVFANPVRQKLAIGIAACMGLNVMTGLLAPGLLHVPFVVALLASTESVLSAVMLRIGAAVHGRELERLGHSMAERATGESLVRKPEAEWAPV